MNAPQRKFILSIITICALLPIVITVILLRSEYTIYVILVNIICLVLLIISYLIYVFKETNIKIRITVLLAVPLIITLYFVSHGFILERANKTNFLLLSKSKHISLLYEIKGYNFKQIVVSRNREYVRVDNYVYGNDSIQSQLKIPIENLDSIIDKMESYGIYYMNKHDGIFYFTSGGFIDSESGYAFSENEDRPIKNHTGTVYTWQKVDDNWYYWYAD